MVKYLLQEMNDVRNTGKRTVYLKVVINQSLGTDEFIDVVRDQLRTVEEGLVRGVVSGIADSLVSLLSKGNNVTLDDIGTFSMSLKFLDDKPTEIQEEGDPMLYRRVGVKDLNFKISPKLIRDLQMNTRFERMTTGARELKKNLYSFEQRIENALAIIDEKGHITLGEYAKVNNLSRTTASKELAKITADPNMPIDYTGQASHKIWIRRKGE